jgi:hypothetical protein
MNYTAIATTIVTCAIQILWLVHESTTSPVWPS